MIITNTRAFEWREGGRKGKQDRRGWKKEGWRGKKHILAITTTQVLRRPGKKAIQLLRRFLRT